MVEGAAPDLCVLESGCGSHRLQVRPQPRRVGCWHGRLAYPSRLGRTACAKLHDENVMIFWFYEVKSSNRIEDITHL